MDMGEAAGRGQFGIRTGRYGVENGGLSSCSVWHADLALYSFSFGCRV